MFYFISENISISCNVYNMAVSFKKSSFPSLDVNRLHLIYPHCTAWSTTTHIYLSTSLNGCSTSYVETEDSLVFSNVVQQDAQPINSSAFDGSDLITREHDFELPFECNYSRTTLLTLPFAPEGRTLPKVGGWYLSLNSNSKFRSRTQIPDIHHCSKPEINVAR